MNLFPHLRRLPAALLRLDVCVHVKVSAERVQTPFEKRLDAVVDCFVKKGRRVNGIGEGIFLLHARTIPSRSATTTAATPRFPACVQLSRLREQTKEKNETQSSREQTSQRLRPLPTSEEGRRTHIFARLFSGGRAP